MVSADNLNLDCLETVFAYLSGNDLVSVSLVSRSFLAGVIPHLYRSLVFHMGNSKRYPKVPSPFDIVVQRPNLAAHVRSIDIRTVPLVKSSYHPKFLINCREAITLCTNLKSFTCTPNILPSFLLALEGRDSIEHLRVNATLTPDQAKFVTTLTRLRTLSLDSCSWNVVDVLPNWANALQSSLTCLTLSGVQELHNQILDAILMLLPNLTSLHVIGCTKVEHTGVLQAVAHTPNLENLSITAWDARALPIGGPPLPNLRHLTLDTHVAMRVGASASTPALWTSIISCTRSWSCPLQSITFRSSDRWPIPHLFVRDLLDAHGFSLRQIALLNCDLGLDSIRAIAARSPELERLAICVPKSNIYALSEALSSSKSLKTLTGIGETHTKHGARAFLTREHVKTIMETVDNLRKIATDGRIWTCDKQPGWMNEGFKIKLEKRKSANPSYWFLPPLQFS